MILKSTTVCRNDQQLEESEHYSGYKRRNMNEDQIGRTMVS